MSLHPGRGIFSLGSPEFGLSGLRVLGSGLRVQRVQDSGFRAVELQVRYGS